MLGYQTSTRTGAHCDWTKTFDQDQDQERDQKYDGTGTRTGTMDGTRYMMGPVPRIGTRFGQGPGPGLCPGPEP